MRGRTPARPTSCRVLRAGSTVVVLGGTAAVSEGVAQSIRELGFAVERIAGPVLLTRPDRVRGDALDYLSQRVGSMTTAWVLGGDAAVSPAAKEQVDQVLVGRCGF